MVESSVTGVSDMSEVLRLKGIVRNGVVVPMEEVALPEGAIVEIVVAEETEWSLLSHQAFAEDWESEEDSTYDNWKEHYGVSTG
jgi:predicted DNA-binding antitoxin AbrB/MazE fold protein